MYTHTHTRTHTHTHTHTHTGITTTHPLSGSAQFFVALGVLTIIYVVGAVLIYMLFITPELYLAKWLVIGVSQLVIVISIIVTLCVCVCVCVCML